MTSSMCMRVVSLQLRNKTDNINYFLSVLSKLVINILNKFEIPCGRRTILLSVMPLATPHKTLRILICKFCIGVLKLQEHAKVILPLANLLSVVAFSSISQSHPICCLCCLLLTGKTCLYHERCASLQTESCLIT